MGYSGKHVKQQKPNRGKGRRREREYNKNHVPIPDREREEIRWDVFFFFFGLGGYTRGMIVYDFNQVTRVLLSLAADVVFFTRQHP